MLNGVVRGLLAGCALSTLTPCNATLMHWNACLVMAVVRLLTLLVSTRMPWANSGANSCWHAKKTSL